MFDYDYARKVLLGVRDARAEISLESLTLP